MTQINLTDQERIEALIHIGYTEREAAFLCAVALNGGFFLRRQYCQFLGMGSGQTVTSLIEKVVAKRHAVTIAGPHNSRVHHLSARPFYAALGQEDNRNRRERPFATMKNRLMGLDFVLEHRGRRFLATEQEKLTFFRDNLAIDQQDFPHKTFRSPDSKASTTRFFVDKYPISVQGEPTASASISFSFIDEGTVTTARFESHLMQYSRLFARLARFEVIYVAARPQVFSSAERAFQCFITAKNQVRPARFTVGEIGRLADYFRLRKLYEDSQLEPFDRDTLIRFRDMRSEFSGPFFQALYARWGTDGDRAFEKMLDREHLGIDPSSATFSTYRLEHSYEFFGV